MLVKTQRLTLREHVSDDWSAIHTYTKLPDFSKYDTWDPQSEEDAQLLVHNFIIESQKSPRQSYDLAITLNSTGELIGGVGVRRESPGSSIVSLYYVINPNFQNQGYAKEAAWGLICKLPNDIKVLYAECDTENKASYKVMKKLGMRDVGLVHEESTGKPFNRCELNLDY